jgi:hypothetical protein
MGMSPYIRRELDENFRKGVSCAPFPHPHHVWVDSPTRTRVFVGQSTRQVRDHPSPNPLKPISVHSNMGHTTHQIWATCLIDVSDDDMIP